MDTEIFFPPRDKDLYKQVADNARAICLGKDGKAACPVRVECFVYAVETDTEHGIWGGASHRERNTIKRKAIKSNMSVEEFLNGKHR